MVAELINVGGLRVLNRGFSVPDELRGRLAAFTPKSALGRIVRECFAYLPADLAGELLDRITSVCVLESALAVVHIRADGRRFDHGEVGHKVITTAGVNYLVDAWQNSVELESMKYHGVGTGNTAEAAGDTALVTESTTALNPDSTRATGTTTEGASANIFRSVGTLTADASIAAVEHGLFNQAATGGGTLWDRTVFATVTLASGDSITFTYDLTASAGG